MTGFSAADDTATPAPEVAASSPSASRPSRSEPDRQDSRPIFPPRTNLRPAWLAVTCLLIAAVMLIVLIVWRVDDLRRDWLIGALIGTILLALAGLFDALLLVRSRRPLDITHNALMVAADDLATSYTTLAQTHHELVETAEARDRALTALRTAVREREAFLASVSHDLNTPLTVIKGHAQILHNRARRADSLDAGMAARALASIEQSATQMESLIEELLGLARLEMGQVPEIVAEPTDLVALARQLVLSHGRVTDLHRIHFTTETDSVIGRWDVSHLERILGNLLENAIKYSPTGGDILVAVHRAADGAHVQLVVTDHGIGIPAADLPRIFERFYRASNVDGLVDGTGLGLAGVRYLVEANGGAITVESQAGDGSTFTVLLPLPPADERVASP